MQRQPAVEAGFTLIELLIVLAIMGALAAVVVASVSGVPDRGSRSACLANVSAINDAAEAYYAQYHVGAGSLDSIVTSGFLHGDPNISGNALTTKEYTLTFTPGGASDAGNVNSGACP